MNPHTLSIVHRVVITGSVLSAALVWFLTRNVAELTTSQTILMIVFPGASLAIACYCVCMVFDCMGRRR